ncbi:hypothetical protein FB45DRAFT_70725 [Roridomyces roridus]|uniref:Mid2 domain-containing protein n=1 Tax=Roridomyces roridus TaxID=1738132 RepID=A0AAD7BMP9_9AGAR|nr:hypothetical protein FB45DRAFT_70725 [Roridomyces roridus]
MSSFPFLSLTVVVFVLTGLSTGATVTATIDDTRGDSQTGAMPVYLPVGAFSSDTTDWEGPVDPDPTQAFDGTWQAVGPSASVTLSFTGTGIDVFCILANTLPTDLSFTLDGAPYYPSFSRTPDASAPDLMYGEQGRVLSIDGLDQVAHQLVIAPNPPAGSNDTLFLFDYARYRFDDEAAPSVGLTVIPPQISLTSASFSDATSTTAPSLTASSSSPSSRPSTSTSALGSTSPIAPSKHVKVLLATLIPAFLLLLASCAVIALLLLRRRPRRGSGSEQQGTVGIRGGDYQAGHRGGASPSGVRGFPP